MNPLRIPSCICVISVTGYGAIIQEDRSYVWNIDPECPYHLAAADDPTNHHIPWNCPTYWNGCNCDGGDPLR